MLRDHNIIDQKLQGIADGLCFVTKWEKWEGRNQVENHLDSSYGDRTTEAAARLITVGSFTSNRASGSVEALVKRIPRGGVSSLGFSFTHPKKSFQTDTLPSPHPLSHPWSCKHKKKRLHVLQINLRGYPALSQS